MANRLKLMGSRRYSAGFDVVTHPETLDIPLRWKKPRTVFVNSMSDLFHERIPTDYIKRVFESMNRAHWHTFQVLTKRPERLAQLANEFNWTPNIWMGVTVESKLFRSRIDLLRTVPAAVRFLSLEPLLNSLGALDLRDIHWVIVGGESGPGSRPMLKAWVAEIQVQCHKRRVPFFFKQWGGVNKAKRGRLLDGQEFNEMPAEPFRPAPSHNTM